MIRIRVPATSANIGPGFDALGLALGLYNRFEAEEAETLAIAGAAPGCAGEDNLFLLAYYRGLDELGYPRRGLRLRFLSDIPVARGLGSSAACIVGGLLAAGAAGGQPGLDKARILDLAAEVEGHPDNTTPALLGGFAASIVEASRVVHVRVPVGQELRLFALVPPFQLSTRDARAALPAQIPFRDAARNSGRAALVAAAFATRDWERLEFAVSDRLHESARAPLIPGFEAAVAAAREAGALAVWLSGAGPSIMALARPGGASLEPRLREACAGFRPAPWRLIPLRADDEGAYLE